MTTEFIATSSCALSKINLWDSCLKSKRAPERNKYILRNTIIKICLSSYLMSADSSSVNGVCLTTNLRRLNKLLEMRKCQSFLGCY